MLHKDEGGGDDAVYSTTSGSIKGRDGRIYARTEETHSMTRRGEREAENTGLTG